MKLFAWNDRRERKDAWNIASLLQNYDKVVEDVIEKRFHQVNLAAFDEVAPCFHEGVLHQVFAQRAIAHLEKCVRTEGLLVVGVRCGQLRLSLCLLFWRHHIGIIMK